MADNKPTAAEQFRENYVTPSLRAAAFWRLHPGAHVEFHTVPFDEAFPSGTANPTKATEAIICTIVFPDGNWVEAGKEIDRTIEAWDGPQGARRKVIKDRVIEPKDTVSDRSKAFGRAMTLAGVPMNKDPFQTLLRWIVALEAGDPKARHPSVRPITDQAPEPDREPAEVRHLHPVADSPPIMRAPAEVIDQIRYVDAPAGPPANVDPATGEIKQPGLRTANTPEAVQQRLVEELGAVSVDDVVDDDPAKAVVTRFQKLPAKWKPEIAKLAKERAEISNCMKTTAAQAPALAAIIDEIEAREGFKDEDMVNR